MKSSGDVVASPTDDVISGRQANATAASAQPESRSGDLLWLWYLVFTVVLLVLIAASFVRFHFKRVQQQKAGTGKVAE